MSMPKMTVVVGILLVIQGVGFYLGTSSKSITALIPMFVGLPIVISGLVAFRPSVRMHAMHVSAMLALTGLAAAIGRIVTAGLSLTAAGASLVIMVLLCGGFLVFCIKSFRAARQRQRDERNKTKESTT